MLKGCRHREYEDCVKKQGFGSLAFEKSKSRKDLTVTPCPMDKLNTAYRHVLHATNALEELAECDGRYAPLAKQARELLWATGTALPLHDEA